MRHRLLKCSVGQVRPATQPEVLGAELLDNPRFDQLGQELRHPGKRVGAVDVESGAPPPEAWD
eukprot:4303203-Pyramimonas_sp.AAC.1